MQCPRCGQSNSFRKKGFRQYSGGVRRQQYQCKNCGHIFVPKEVEK